MEGLSCNWEACEYTAKTDSWNNCIRVMVLHERGKHGVVGVAEKEGKEDDRREDKGERKRQEKRAQAKLPTFEEV